MLSTFENLTHTPLPFQVVPLFTPPKKEIPQKSSPKSSDIIILLDYLKNLTCSPQRQQTFDKLFPLYHKCS